MQPPDAGAWASAHNEATRRAMQVELDDKAHATTLEYALAAILDTHTRILAAHPPSPKRQAKRAAWRKNAAAFAARHRAERRGK